MTPNETVEKVPATENHPILGVRLPSTESPPSILTRSERSISLVARESFLKTTFSTASTQQAKGRAERGTRQKDDA
jgi:hypothetical protein